MNWLLHLIKTGVLYVLGLTIALFFAFILYGATMNWIIDTCTNHPKSGWCQWSILQTGSQD